MTINCKNIPVDIETMVIEKRQEIITRCGLCKASPQLALYELLRDNAKMFVELKKLKEGK